MGSTQLYSLTWGEFGTSLVSAVQLLRCHGDLVDVTLAAGGQSFPAHKIVLCAASPFLLNLLKSTPCQHPVVMLAGVTAPDLEALLEFVYRGEVSVDSSQLPSLLQAAHCLNIQGLAPGTLSAEKPEDLGAVASAHEALTRDVINSFLPIRRRKRIKHRNSTGPQSKWARQDGECPDAENRPVELAGGVLPLPGEHDVLHIPDVPRKTEDGEHLSGQHADDSTAPLAGGDATAAAGGAGKARGASDQPGACPLCGAMLRQARNLRRHLLTSCKYRMMGPAAAAAAAASSSAHGPLAPPPPPPPLPQQPLMAQAPHPQHHHPAEELQRLGVAPEMHRHQQQLPPPPPRPPHPAVQLVRSAVSPGPQGPPQSAPPPGCEHIVCKVSPLPSPMSSCSTLLSPGCGLVSPQPPSMVPPQ